MKITVYVYKRKIENNYFSIDQKVEFTEDELERLAIEAYLDNSFITLQELKDQGYELSANVENINI
jgi:hypothetical protein